MEKQTKLHLELDGAEVTLTITRATVYAASKRYQMMVAAEEENRREGADPVLAPSRMFTYPKIISVTSAVEGMPWPQPLEAATCVLGLLSGRSPERQGPHRVQPSPRWPLLPTSCRA